MSQLRLPFMDELDRRLADERQAAAKASHEANAAIWLKHAVDHYPASPAEWEIMLMGIRLARFVSDLECHQCNLACEDHTADWMFPTNVCLKDYYALRKKLGLRK